jgi:hypothetical protein
VKPYESWLFGLALITALCGIGFALLSYARPARICLAFALIDVILAAALVAAARVWK